LPRTLQRKSPLQPKGSVVYYAGLVASPACFARAESRSSLRPDDSFSPHAVRADEHATFA